MQPAIVIIAGGLGALAISQLPGEDVRMLVLFLLGGALGATLYFSSFGFSSAYRSLLTGRDRSGVRAQIIMVALATALFVPALAQGELFGQAVSGATAPVSVQVALGACLFGIGMQLAGGCGSGTLYAAGGGSVRMLVVLVFFCAASFWASLHFGWWQSLPSLGEVVLGEQLGWTAAAVLQWTVLGAIWIALRRPRTSATKDGRPIEAPHAATASLMRSGIALALLAFLVLLAAGHPWSITWGFTLWAAKVARLVGWQPEESGFWSAEFQSRALQGNVFDDVTSVMNFGILLGAMGVAGALGRFRLGWPPTLASLVSASVGGSLMGYGARIAYGCNIGAFFSGVASTSLHGWLWIGAALAGCWIGLRLRPLFGLEN